MRHGICPEEQNPRDCFVPGKFNFQNRWHQVLLIVETNLPPFHPFKAFLQAPSHQLEEIASEVATAFFIVLLLTDIRCLNGNLRAGQEDAGLGLERMLPYSSVSLGQQAGSTGAHVDRISNETLQLYKRRYDFFFLKPTSQL